ncbi:hypothetical protein ABK040_002220 [Willaertia magna]
MITILVRYVLFIVMFITIMICKSNLVDYNEEENDFKEYNNDTITNCDYSCYCCKYCCNQRLNVKRELNSHRHQLTCNFDSKTDIYELKEYLFAYTFPKRQL